MEFISVKLILFAAAFFLIFFIYSTRFESVSKTSKSRDKYGNLTKCYHIRALQNENGFLLSDVLDSSRKPRPGKTIFFHETKCSKNGLLELGPRQVCSIESAAKNNPNIDIFVLFSSPRYLHPDILSSEIWRLKLTYKNIFLRNNDIWRYAENSSAFDFMESGRLFESHFLPVHMSDLLRLLSVWRFGGIYMDSDIIVQKSFENLPLNYGALEEQGEYMNNGVLSLEPNGFGHSLGDMFIEDFSKNFDPVNWAMNGPRLITRVMKKVCNTNSLIGIPADTCHGFKIYPRDTFWAVSYKVAKDFFNPKKLEVLESQSKNSYSIHVFNHLTKNIKHKIGTKSLYGVVTQKQCPVTYENAGSFL